MQYVAVAAAVVGGISSIRQGQAQQAMYNQQAQQASAQARSAVLSQRADTLKYKQDGVEVLKNLARNLATVNARAAAGSVDPFSGSVDNLVTANLEKGVTDFYMTRENQQISKQQAAILEASGNIQAAQYQFAGKTAKRQGYMNALAQFGQAYQMGTELGTFNSSPFGRRTGRPAPIEEKTLDRIG